MLNDAWCTSVGDDSSMAHQLNPRRRERICWLWFRSAGRQTNRTAFCYQFRHGMTPLCSSTSPCATQLDMVWRFASHHGKANSTTQSRPNIVAEWSCHCTSGIELRVIREVSAGHTLSLMTPCTNCCSQLHLHQWYFLYGLNLLFHC